MRLVRVLGDEAGVQDLGQFVESATVFEWNANTEDVLAAEMAARARFLPLATANARSVFMQVSDGCHCDPAQ